MAKPFTIPNRPNPNRELAAVRRELRDTERVLREALLPGTQTLHGDTLARRIIDEVLKLRRMLAAATIDELKRLRKVRDNIEALYMDKHTDPAMRVTLAALCGPLVSMSPMSDLLCPAPSSTTGTSSRTPAGTKGSRSPVPATRPATRKTKRSSASKR